MLARPRLHKSILRNLVGIRRLNNKYIHLFETIASSKTLESLSGTETVPKTVSGFGGSLNDPAEALKVSLYEAMERLFGFEDQQTKMVKSTYARLADEAINPTRFFPTKCLQYEHSRHTKYSSQIPLSWVRVYTLDMRVSKLVPASLVILGFSSSHPSEYIFPLTSSGLAAHPDLKESLVHGCLELIESDAFQIVWLNRLSRPLVCPDTITDSNVNKTIDVMEEDGFQISFIDLTSDLGVPVILTKIFNPKINWRSAPVFGLGCSLWPETSLKKSLTEAVMQLGNYYLFEKNGSFRLRKALQTTHTGTAAYFRKALFLDGSRCFIKLAEVGTRLGSLTPADQLFWLHERLKATGHDAYFFEFTLEYLRSFKFHLIRALIPGLEPLILDRTRFCAGRRIFTVPLRLGFVGSKRFAGLNFAPSPFALLEG